MADVHVGVGAAAAVVRAGHSGDVVGDGTTLAQSKLAFASEELHCGKHLLQVVPSASSKL